MTNPIPFLTYEHVNPTRPQNPYYEQQIPRSPTVFFAMHRNSSDIERPRSGPMLPPSRLRDLVMDYVLARVVRRRGSQLVTKAFL